MNHGKFKFVSKILSVFILFSLFLFLLGVQVDRATLIGSKAAAHSQLPKSEDRVKPDTSLNRKDPLIQLMKEKQHKETMHELEKAPKQVHLNAPLIKQLPELPRGCEVTSLAMLLRFAGIKVSKMDLAKQIKKDPTPYKREGTQVYFGDPNNGFVGSMKSLQQPGYGVYHGPVAELAEQYLGNKVVDLSGRPFQSVINQLADGYPVWVINNTHFSYLPSEDWETWETPDGPIKITYDEHAVLVTGYDEEDLYFNDPLAGVKDRKVKKDSFIRGWKQMGSQAISYVE